MGELERSLLYEELSGRESGRSRHQRRISGVLRVPLNTSYKLSFHLKNSTAIMCSYRPYLS